MRPHLFRFVRALHALAEAPHGKNRVLSTLYDLEALPKHLKTSTANKGKTE